MSTHGENGFQSGRRVLSEARNRVVKLGARSIGRAWRVLPDRFVLAVRGELQQTGRMDYPASPIHLYVDSEQDRAVRLRACQKEPETVAWISSEVAQGDVFYDIGANIGSYSLIAAAHTSRRMKIYAFEPSFANFAQLNRNVLLNKCEGVIAPLPVALWREPGVRLFRHRTVDTGGALHSIDTGSDQGFRAVYTQPVLTFRLDDFMEQFFLEPPNHIKIDVDGEELEILHGAGAVLGHDGLRSMLVEVYEDNAMAITSLLEEHGLHLRSKHWHAGMRAWNCIFVRDSEGAHYDLGRSATPV